MCLWVLTLAHFASMRKSKTFGKPYSGKFVLRIDPSLHARLAVKAQAQGMSLNQYAADVLAHV